MIAENVITASRSWQLLIYTSLTCHKSPCYWCPCEEIFISAEAFLCNARHHAHVLSLQHMALTKPAQARRICCEELVSPLHIKGAEVVTKTPLLQDCSVL